MKKIFDKILINEIIEYKGSIDELIEKINDQKSQTYRVEWISNKKFEFISNWSIGTKGEIKGYGTINENKENNKLEIHLATKMRNEVYMILGVTLFFFVGILFVDEKVPIWIYFLFPIVIIWFWGGCRIQENSLFGKVKKHLTN
ncbi:MAG: hypothetical protein DHS20C18_35490 [Saprospiraceae bacterium]|nr:MAG: hypothetical protein DHS20C18_35490 [Saprospiraceae bacterium]